MREIIAVTDLTLGMFVCELDRPWLDAPFLLQGFLIEDEDALGKLRALCRFVYVDRARSVGDAWRAEVNSEKLRPAANLAAYQVEIAAQVRRSPLDFFALLRSMRIARETPDGQGGTVDVAEQKPPPWMHRYPEQNAAPAADLAEKPAAANFFRPGAARRRVDAQGGGSARHVYVPSVSVEEEIVTALPVVDRAQSLLAEIVRDVQSSLNPDLERLRGVVGDMVVSVARNPDALLWLLRLKQTDQYSYDHSLDVAAHVMIFARYLGLGADMITTLGMAGMLQDVGKLRLPARLLHKVGPISRREYEIFKTHVDFSLQILSGTPHASALLLEIVGRHHERCDGSGYPVGYAGDLVGLPAEIAGMCDVYCAMTRDRPGGGAASSQAALEAVRAMRGQGFSATTVDQFIQCIGIYPVGTLVEMNSGEVAVVVAQNRIRRLKPRVMMLLGPDKQPNSYPQTVDLIYDPPNAVGEPYAIVKALVPGAYGIDPAEYYLA